MVCCFAGIGVCIVFGLFAFGGCWVVFPSVLPVVVVGMSKPPRDFSFGGFFSGVGGGGFCSLPPYGFSLAYWRAIGVVKCVFSWLFFVAIR